jgi:hypothetical protein
VVCCIPFLGFYQNTEYTYPLLTALFMGMEEAGWKRQDVYDLFAEMTSDGAARENIYDVKRRVCRGDIITKAEGGFLASATPLKMLGAWAEAPPNMWKANRAVVDVDMTDTLWILHRYALIRPRDKKTLDALERLNLYLCMWKFVKTEEDLRVEGYWQYIVL